MRLFDYISKLRAAFRGKQTMLDFMLKAMSVKAAAQLRPRRPKRRLHLGSQVEMQERLVHRLPSKSGQRRTREVRHYYQPYVDGSKYRGDKLRALRADGKHR